VAVNGWVAPIVIEAEAGLTVMDCSTGVLDDVLLLLLLLPPPQPAWAIVISASNP
jgi:hypothetical protein